MVQVSWLIAVRFVYGPSESYTVYLTTVSRTYGSFTAHRKAVRFVYGPLEGRTVHFTDRKQDLRLTWSTGTSGRNFLRISFAFYGFIKANYGGYTQAVLFLSTASI
jgi:hypothetical protein